MKIIGTNLSMTRGDSESISVTFTNYEPQAGDVVEMTVRKNAKGSAVMRKKAEFSGNKAIIAINPEDTERLDFGRYVYDVQLTYGGAVKTVIPISELNILEEVTYG